MLRQSEIWYSSQQSFLNMERSENKTLYMPTPTCRLINSLKLFAEVLLQSPFVSFDFILKSKDVCKSHLLAGY